MPAAAARASDGAPALTPPLDEQLVAAMEGVVRDERGLRFERGGGLSLLAWAMPS